MHEFELRATETDSMMKGEPITYEEKFLYCRDSGSEFYTKDVVRENALSAKASYEEKVRMRFRRKEGTA